MLSIRPSISGVKVFARVYLLKAHTLHTACDVSTSGCRNFYCFFFSLYSFVNNIIVTVSRKHRLLVSCVFMRYFVVITYRNRIK